MSGPYIASTGTHLELIAKNYVKLAEGFRAEADAEFKIAVDPTMSIPACPTTPTASSNNRIRNQQTATVDPSVAKVLLSPNPAQRQTTVSLLQAGQQKTLQRLQLHDLKGQLIFTQASIQQPT
jgi:hypothetical protein